MQAAEKRKQEFEKLKGERINHILDCSFVLFAKNGMDSMTMNEIASYSEIGVASLYRYFVTKEDLAIQVAVHAWKTMQDAFSAVYQSEEYEKLSGIQQVEKLFSVFPEAYIQYPEFFRFIYYFDAFMRKESIDQSRLIEYEAKINSLKDVVVAALNKGLSDGTVKIPEEVTVEQIYSAVMHSLFSTSQKLSLAQGLLAMDDGIRPSEELKLIVRLCVEVLSVK